MTGAPLNGPEGGAAFFVPGLPRPQGSKRIGRDRRGRPIILNDNDAALKVWRRAVAVAAADRWPLAAEPATVDVTFYLPRGKTVRRALPTTKPDLDKLARALLDGLVEGGLLPDDSLVVDLLVRKRYADASPPGAQVTVELQK